MIRIMLKRCEGHYPYYRDVYFEEMIECGGDARFDKRRNKMTIDDALWHVLHFHIDNLVAEVWSDGKWSFEYRLARNVFDDKDFVTIWLRTSENPSQEYLYRIIQSDSYRDGLQFYVY